MNRGWAALCVAFFAAGSCGGPSSGTSVEGRYASVSEIVSILEEDGISCGNLTVKDKEELEAQREARPEYSPPPGFVPAAGPEYDVHESGFCQFGGSPEVSGREIASTVTVYENDEHLESIPEEGFLGVALVYGDNWLVQSSNPELADSIADSLGGKVVPPLDMPFDDRDVAEAGPRCFFLAAFPPGLQGAAERMGLSGADPDEFARAFGESAYYLPDDVQKAIEESCRIGLEMEDAVRGDEPTLRTKEFEHFWLAVCAHSAGDLSIPQELGFTKGFSFTELGATLTRRFLEGTSLGTTATRKLGRRCGAAVEEGAIGDLG